MSPEGTMKTGVKAMLIAGRIVKQQSDLEQLSTKDLLGFYNAQTGRLTKKFHSRKVGLKQVWDLLSSLDEFRTRREREEKARGGPPREPPVHPPPQLTPAKEKPAKRKRVKQPARISRKGRGFSFRLAPKPEQRTPREGSKRALILELTSQPQGGLFSEIVKQCEWTVKDAYEGTRLLNVFNGFGLWHEREGETDYRIWVVDSKEFSRRAGMAARQG
jgi:hypothetical protein